MISRDDHAERMRQFPQPLIEIKQPFGAPVVHHEVPGMDEKVALRDLDLSMNVMGIRDHDDGKAVGWMRRGGRTFSQAHEFTLIKERQYGRGSLVLVPKAMERFETPAAQVMPVHLDVGLALWQVHRP